MITEGYERCRQRKLPSMPSHEQKLPSMLSHERKLSATLMIPTTTYAEKYELRVWMVGGVWVRKWRCGGYGSSSAVSFCSFDSFSSLLFISSLDLGPVQMASAWVFTTYHWRWSFPVRRIRRKVAIELYRSVVGLMGSYDCVRRVIVSFLVSLSFSSLILALAAQEVCP